MKYDENENTVFPEEILTEEERRELRRERRRKNQLIARASSILCLLLIIAGIVAGTSFLKVKINSSKAAKEEALSQEQVIAQEEVPLQTEDFSKEPEAIADEEEQQPDEKEVLDEVVEAVISEMTLEEKVAGIFMVCPEDITGVDVAVQAGEGTKKALEQYPVGGLIYFGKNIKSSEQIKEMIRNTVSYAKYPIFIAVDEEGGDVARLAKGLNLNNPGPMSEIGATNDPTKAKEAMVQISSYLKEYGVNLDLAPVADILDENGVGPIKNRSFGKDPVLVSNMVVAALEGLEENGITGCVKHFPGFGEAIEDTHEKMSVINRSKEELYAKELLPFVAAIEAGAEMIMVGHTSYPQISGDNTPATLSKEIISELLREELGYNGVVITDAMNMAAISEYYSSDEAAVKALKAGADMLLMPEDFETAYRGVLDAVAEGTISEERIDDCLKRIYRIKYKDSVGN